MMKSKMMAGGGAMKSKMMASGGMPMVMKDGKSVPAFAADGKGKMAHGGKVHKMAGGGMAKSKMMAGGGMMKSKMMASGGSASKRADGIAIKGKTKGKMMSRGGKAC